jgi:hypothetical protein
MAGALRRDLGERERQREDVGPRTGLAEALGVPLLGGGVRGREHRRVSLRGRAAGVPGRCVAHLGDAEVEDADALGAAELGDEDVVWLEVAVKDAQRTVWARERVGTRQRPRDGGQEGDRFGERQRRVALVEALHDHVLQRDALEPLERDERHEAPVGELEGVELERSDDLGDRGREAEHHLAFLLEALEELRAVGRRELRRDLQALQRDRRGEPQVVGTIDDREAAVRDHGLDAEDPGDVGADDAEGIGRRGRGDGAPRRHGRGGGRERERGQRLSRLRRRRSHRRRRLRGGRGRGERGGAEADRAHPSARPGEEPQRRLARAV